MKNLLLVIWLLYFSATCKQIGTKPDLIFINATSQDWSGGAAGSGQGTNYNFYFIKKSVSVTCDSVWVNGFVLPVKSFLKPNNDTLRITASAFFRRKMGAQDRMPVIEPKKEASPVAVTGAAVISYTSGNVVKYITVPAIKRLKAMAYP